jgi:hypothetical protein
MHLQTKEEFEETKEMILQNLLCFGPFSREKTRETILYILNNGVEVKLYKNNVFLQEIPFILWTNELFGMECDGLIEINKSGQVKPLKPPTSDSS